MRRLRIDRQLRGAVVPHAPVLIEGLSGERPEDTARLRGAVSAVDAGEAEVIVLLSPHGARAGVYRRPAGSLDGFGIPGVRVERATDPGCVNELAGYWRQPVLDAPADHGVIVPLLLRRWPEVPVVAATLLESTGPGAAPIQTALDAGDGFVDALGTLAASRRVFLLASANTSAGLSPRAPLTELESATTIERRMVSEAAKDCGALARLAPELARRGGSCAAGTLRAFGRLFEGSPLRVAAHAWPFGVGYLVGTASQGD